MAVHTLRIESNSEWSAVEIRSAGTWARGPGRTLSYQAAGGDLHQARLEVDDRVVRLVQAAESRTEITLLIQLATLGDRVSLHTRKARNGTLKVVSAANTRTNEGRGDDGNGLDVLLFLDVAAAAEAGVALGDPTLR
jgi:hypothetical protein